MEIKIIKRTMSKSVIKDIIEIDKEFYKDFDYSNTEWYFKRYNNKNSIFLLMLDNKIIGYFLFYKISKKLFDDIRNLKYSGDYVFPIEEVNVKSNYYYLPSILVKKRFRQYSLILIKRLKQEIDKIENLVVITISKNGKRLAEKSLIYLGSPKGEKSVNIYVKKL